MYKLCSKGGKVLYNVMKITKIKRKKRIYFHNKIIKTKAVSTLFGLNIKMKMNKKRFSAFNTIKHIFYVEPFFIYT